MFQEPKIIELTKQCMVAHGEPTSSASTIIPDDFSRILGFRYRASSINYK
jgi:hypothetical protein